MQGIDGMNANRGTINDVMRTRVLFLSGRETDYIRNRVLLAALRTHFDVKVFTPGMRSTPGRVISGLLRFVARQPEYDVCFAGFYGQPTAIALSVLQDKPVILDAYVSTYDTLVEDRHWFGPRSPGGRIARWLDQRGCQSADYIITDTHANGDYLIERFDIPRDDISTVYVGCDETVFYPRDESRILEDKFEVFYYGSFLPLHGVDVIIEAAALLRDRPEIHFTLGGDGRLRAAVEQKVDELALTNVEFIGWIPLEQVPEHISQASICLGGHFSSVPKAARVVSTKTFQFIAMRKATVVGDNAATRELFRPGEDVYAVPMGDPKALAEAIRTLTADVEVRQRVARGGYEIFRERLSTRSIAQQLASILEDVSSCGSAS
jgi:glycosyltransferase involved in cell wall biosynthesis